MDGWDVKLKFCLCQNLLRVHLSRWVNKKIDVPGTAAVVLRIVHPEWNHCQSVSQVE